VPRASQILLVGQRIRQLRKSRHLTQADLASRIGITQSDLSRMESGEYKVGLDTLFKILHIFELSMSRFFEEPAPAEKAEADALSGEMPEREQLLADFAQLSDDSRREVREFITFKKQQADRAERAERVIEKAERAERAAAEKADRASGADAPEPRRAKWALASVDQDRAADGAPNGIGSLSRSAGEIASGGTIRDLRESRELRLAPREIEGSANSDGNDEATSLVSLQKLEDVPDTSD